MDGVYTWWQTSGYPTGSHTHTHTHARTHISGLITGTVYKLRNKQVMYYDHLHVSTRTSRWLEEIFLTSGLTRNRYKTSKSHLQKLLIPDTYSKANKTLFMEPLFNIIIIIIFVATIINFYPENELLQICPFDLDTIIIIVIVHFSLQTDDRNTNNVTFSDLLGGGGGIPSPSFR